MGLRCGQTGGVADRIVLWPLGGIAFVNPPRRPGAMLWSIAAGPLVNVILLPILYVALLVFGNAMDAVPTDFGRFVSQVFGINLVLLIFNMLPIYPLDGGQILRALLWFALGRARSLMVATILGLVGIAAFFGFALWSRDSWLGVIAVFMLMNCWSGLQHARALLQFAKLPRRFGSKCVRLRASVLAT